MDRVPHVDNFDKVGVLCYSLYVVRNYCTSKSLYAGLRMVPHIDVQGFVIYGNSGLTSTIFCLNKL